MRATPNYTDATADGTDVLRCTNCQAQVVRNYDGPGTGWSHVYDEGTDKYLHSGTKGCMS